MVVGPQGDVQDRLWSMAEAPRAYDDATTARLKRLAAQRDKLEATYAEALSAVEGDDDNVRADALNAKLEALNDEERTLIMDAEVYYTEATKAIGTTFLLLDPDGRVRTEHRVPRVRPGVIGTGDTDSPGDGLAEAVKPPTSADLKEPQLATTFTHQALAVREAVLQDAKARRRVLAVILHEKVRGDALAIRHDSNGTTLHADRTEGFASTALDAIRTRRAALDPLHDKHYVADDDAYTAMASLPDKTLDALIDVLAVECITAHLQRKTRLVGRLAAELGVDVRRYWRPDERWLSGYQKIQLAHLIGELRGPVYAKAAEVRKKSELVSQLAKLFADAAEGTLEDAKLAATLNGWLPSNLRHEPQADDAAPVAAPAAA